MEEYHQDKNNDFRTGYFCAFKRVISLLTQQAEAFDIDLEDIKLDDIDRTKFII